MQHRVGGVALAPAVIAVEALVQQAGVVEEPQRHGVVDRRLMLDQNVHGLHAAVGGVAVDGPDDVDEAAAQVVVDVFGGVFAQGVEVEHVGPTGRALGSEKPRSRSLTMRR